jgi:hypothetical protein
MPPNAVQNPRRQKRQRIGLSLLSKRKKLTGPTKQSIHDPSSLDCLAEPVIGRALRDLLARKL